LFSAKAQAIDGRQEVERWRKKLRPLVAIDGAA
jgi:hypothetical protein